MEKRKETLKEYYINHLNKNGDLMSFDELDEAQLYRLEQSIGFTGFLMSKLNNQLREAYFNSYFYKLIKKKIQS